MIIKLVRHGESDANTGEINPQEFGNHLIDITKVGERQSRMAGETIALDPNFFTPDPPMLAYCSPYHRTRRTMHCLLEGAGVKKVRKIYEDPRIREMEWGYSTDPDLKQCVRAMREIHGRFYYRIDGEESPADVYDRVSAFLETMMRQIERKKAVRVLIVTHASIIRCFVTRFMHLKVEQHDEIKNPENCDIVTISNEGIVNPPSLWAGTSNFTTGQWKAYGVRVKDVPADRAQPYKCLCGAVDMWRHFERDQDNDCAFKCETCGEVGFTGARERIGHVFRHFEAIDKETKE